MTLLLITFAVLLVAGLPIALAMLGSSLLVARCACDVDVVSPDLARPVPLPRSRWTLWSSVGS